MWPQTELPHMISECVPIAFIAALLSVNLNIAKAVKVFFKKANPFPPNLQTISQTFTKW